MAHISLQGVSKSYGRGAPPAVRQLDLDIEKGAFLCLLGPSGCGKTTTLRMIAGLEHPTAGRIEAAGRTLASVEEGIYVPAEAREMGLVFQNYALWPHMTVAQNAEFGLSLRKIPKAERRERVAQVLEVLGIARFADRYPSQLSGGQQQRVALARMLALRPGIILLDEPLSNLDAKLRLEMRAELKRIHHEIGATVIFVTHDQWEAMTLATTIAVMSEGALQQLGSPDDIYERPGNRFVAEFVGNLPINMIALAEPGPLSDWARALLDAQMPGAQPATLGIRPETLRLHPAQPGDPWRAELREVVPTGGNWIVELSLRGAALHALTAEPPAALPGAEVALSVAPHHLHLFDAAGQRLRA